MKATSAAWLVGAASAVLVAAMQLVCIVRVHDGDPTGPFLVGAGRAAAADAWPIPIAAADSEVGYDGQFYLVLAFDPLLRTPLTRLLDDPGYRARRILWPAAARFLSFGSDRAVPLLLALLLTVAIATGSGLVAGWAIEQARSPLWGLVLALNVGNLLSVWRMLGDPVMVTLMVSAILVAGDARSHGRGRAALLLALATLQKETAVLGLPAVLRARRGTGREGLAPWWFVSAFLVLGWWVYVLVVAPEDLPTVAAVNLDVPGLGWSEALAKAIVRGVDPARTIKNVTLLVLYGCVLLLGLFAGAAGVVRSGRRREVSAIESSILLFALLGLLLSERVWVEVWAYSRALLPLVGLELLYGLDRSEEDASPWVRRFALWLALAGAAAGVLLTARNALFAIP